MNLVVRYMLGGERIAVSVPATASAKDVVARVPRGRAGGSKAHALFLRGQDLSHYVSMSAAGVEDGDSLLLIELDEPRDAGQGAKLFDGCHADFAPFLRRFYAHDPNHVVEAADALRQRVHATAQGVQLLARGNGLQHVSHLLRSSDSNAANLGLRILVTVSTVDGMEKRLLGLGCAAEAIRLARSGAVAVQRNAITLLFNLSFYTPSHHAMVVRHDLLGTVAHLLESAPHVDPAPSNAVDFRALRLLLKVTKSADMRRHFTDSPRAIDAVANRAAASTDVRVWDRSAKLLHQSTQSAEDMRKLVQRKAAVESLARLRGRSVRYARELMLRASIWLGSAELPAEWEGLAVRDASLSAAERANEQRVTAEARRLARPRPSHRRRARNQQ